MLLLYSGWNTKNIGDQGHTPGTLRFLEKYFPEADITVWLSSTNEETNTILMNRFPKIRIVRGTMDIYGQTDSSQLAKSFQAADLVIHNSGMAFNSFWKAPSILKACNRNSKPIVLFGQSFDGFKPEDEGFMVQQLSRAAAIYCRDTESYLYLRRIGVDAHILEFGPDGCFGIDHAPASQPIKELMRIYETYDHALTKVDRAMTFVEQRGAEMVGDIRRFLRS